jgi:hypothetical protein
VILRQQFGHFRHFKARDRKRKAPIRKMGGVGCSRGAVSPCLTSQVFSDLYYGRVRRSRPGFFLALREAKALLDELL